MGRALLSKGLSERGSEDPRTHSAARKDRKVPSSLVLSLPPPTVRSNSLLQRILF